MKTGFLGSASPALAPSSSDEKANLGIVSRLMVLRRDGLGPRSDREEEAHVQDRSLFNEEGHAIQPHSENSYSTLKTQFPIPTL